MQNKSTFELSQDFHQARELGQEKDMENAVGELERRASSKEKMGKRGGIAEANLRLAIIHFSTLFFRQSGVCDSIDYARIKPIFQNLIESWRHSDRNPEIRAACAYIVFKINQHTTEATSKGMAKHFTDEGTNFPGDFPVWKGNAKIEHDKYISEDDNDDCRIELQNFPGKLKHVDKHAYYRTFHRKKYLAAAIILPTLFLLSFAYWQRNNIITVFSTTEFDGSKFNDLDPLFDTSHLRGGTPITDTFSNQHADSQLSTAVLATLALCKVDINPSPLTNELNGLQGHIFSNVVDFFQTYRALTTLYASRYGEKIAGNHGFLDYLRFFVERSNLYTQHGLAQGKELAAYNVLNMLDYQSKHINAHTLLQTVSFGHILDVGYEVIVIGGEDLSHVAQFSELKTNLLVSSGICDPIGGYSGSSSGWLEKVATSASNIDAVKTNAQTTLAALQVSNSAVSQVTDITWPTSTDLFFERVVYPHISGKFESEGYRLSLPKAGRLEIPTGITCSVVSEGTSKSRISFEANLAEERGLFKSYVRFTTDSDVDNTMQHLGSKCQRTSKPPQEGVSNAVLYMAPALACLISFAAPIARIFWENRNRLQSKSKRRKKPLAFEKGKVVQDCLFGSAISIGLLVAKNQASTISVIALLAANTILAITGQYVGIHALSAAQRCQANRR